MSTKLDIEKVRTLLAELHACDEKLADRGPIKVLPRPPEEIPNLPVLQSRIAAIRESLRVKRKNATAKGHDLDNEGAPIPRDLSAEGEVEEIRSIRKGADRALPKTDVLVRVGFPSGEHLWFDPDDLKTVDRDSEASLP